MAHASVLLKRLQRLQTVGCICLALAFVTLLAFWPVGRLGFINLDDYGKHGYVVDNVNIQSGVTVDSVTWAFTAAHSSNWHPLTWISHMLDYQWFGANPAGHHWVNLGWHVVNVVLLFLLLRQLTGKIWLSALAGILFALHPLRVESVAWVSERKDVLSGFFFLLTLGAWAKHGQSFQESAPGGWLRFWKSKWYWLALFCCALGLMSKPMLVTVPLILLLLDFWPLGRVLITEPPSNRKDPSRAAMIKLLLLEKLPFMALALASCVLTVWAQSKGASIVAAERLPWDWRLLNVLSSYAGYLKVIFWPENLAIFYPYSRNQASWLQFLGLAMAFALFTWFCIRHARRLPWLVVGWGWFVLMLIPVIGLVQVGAQSIADRYTYLPAIGIGIIVSWSLGNLAARSRAFKVGAIAVGVVVSLALLLGVRQQLHYWKDSVTLFSRALAVNGENSTIRYYLANSCWTAGDLEGAARHYNSLLGTIPLSEDIQYRLGYVLLQQRKYGEAEPRLLEVLRINPNNANAQMCLAYALASQGTFDAAEEHFMNAMLLRPGDLEIKASLTDILRQNGTDRTLTNLLQQLKSAPSAYTHARVAMIRLTQRRYSEALVELEAALTLEPQSPEVLNHLAWLLATCPVPSLRDGALAVQYAKRACELTQNRQARTIGTWATALARDGQFEQAILQVKRACALAAASGENDLVSRNQSLLQLYGNHQAFESPN